MDQQVLQDLKINVIKTSDKIGVGSIIKERFILEQKIGDGGMGTVYKARDIRREEANSSSPYVALKVVNDTFKQHPKAFAALQHEAHKAQALNHDNIIRVFDFDRDGDTAFMIMEYLQGINLDHLMKTFAIHGLTYQQKLNLILTVAEALAYAHKQGYVHGDLKPSNIFITNDNTVKIIDFGLANANSEAANEQHFKPEELQAFTPAYASEEVQNWQKPTPADDIYAFACIAYEFLSGSHPYQKLSAKEAKKLQRSLKPIQYMPKLQWRALHQGLALSHAKRKITMQQILDAFANHNKHQKKWWWLFATLVITAIAFLANQFDLLT